MMLTCWIGSQNINTAVEEFSNIITWAAKNNLRLNHTKTKEMIIWKRGTTKLVPAIIPGAIRVESLCILGVAISSDLKMDQHINRVLCLIIIIRPRHASIKGIICRLSPPRRPSHHSVQRHVCIPCMVGICQCTEQRQDRSSNKLYETQRVPPSRTSKCWRYRCQSTVQCHLLEPDHVLGSFLLHPKQHQYHMRTGAHNFSLPPKDNQNSLSRNLYRNITEYIHSIIITVIVIII